MNRVFRGPGLFMMAALCALACQQEPVKQPADQPPVAEPVAKTSLEDLYREARDRFEAKPDIVVGEVFEAMRRDLRTVANEAQDVHLRANASLLLGAMHEHRKEPKLAVDFYGLAARLVPDDAGPKMAQALALAADKRFKDAAEVQIEATKLDPDNLQNWLVLAELLVKSGDEERAVGAYVDYETRRKGLIDGLTLTNKAGAYMVSVDERIACAEALASANDEGTGVAVAYALVYDKEPRVRATAATVMGIQRLSMYRKVLEERLKAEPEVDVRKAIAAALGEVTRDPVKATPVGPPPGIAPPTQSSTAGGAGQGATSSNQSLGKTGTPAPRQ